LKKLTLRDAKIVMYISITITLFLTKCYCVKTGFVKKKKCHWPTGAKMREMVDCSDDLLS
jgi:hypothetical protein